MWKRFAPWATCIALLVLPGCLVGTLDNIGRAGSDAAVVIGYMPPTCTVPVGATNGRLSNVRITLDGKEMKIRSIRDILDSEVESPEDDPGIPTMMYRVAIIRLPKDLKPGKKTVRIYWNDKELTDSGISPVELLIVEGEGRTQQQMPGMQ